MDQKYTPSSKYIKIQSVESFIHQLGPSAWATPSKGVVSLWQTKSGTQCWAYGWWIWPLMYQCDAELLHDITSHPERKQYQQLAYVGQQAADTKSRTKMVSFCEKTAANIWHFQSGQQANIWQCTVPSHTSLVQRTMCWRTLPKYHCGMLWYMTQRPIPFPGGTSKPGELPQSRRGGTNPIPRWSGHLSREVIPESTCVGKKKRRKLCSEHFIVLGVLNFHKKC